MNAWGMIFSSLGTSGLSVRLAVALVFLLQARDSNYRELSGQRQTYHVSPPAGQDIRAHGGEPDPAIHAVRNWLATASKRKSITDVIIALLTTSRPSSIAS